MKRITFLIILGFTIAVFMLGCKKEGSPFLVYRNITKKTMINSYGGYLYLYADPDSVLYSGIHAAEVKAHVFNISDTVKVIGFGHVWSIDNPEPSLRDPHSQYVMTSNSVNFSPNDSDLVFTSRLENLVLDTGYYVRSFVIVEREKSKIQDTAYNQVVSKFHTMQPRDIWFVKQSMTAEVRTGAVAFVINGHPYIGLGHSATRLLSDFWKYDPDEDYWTHSTDFRGGPRTDAAVFVLGDTAYVGTGYLGGDIYARDFFKFDEGLYNAWILIDSMPQGTERAGAVGFSGYYQNQWRGFIAFGHWYYKVNNTEYYKNEIYMYDYTKDTIGGNPWSVAYTVSPSMARYGAIAVSDGRTIIWGSGKGPNGYFNDFHYFDLATTGFSVLYDLPPLPGPPRANGVAALIKFERDGQTYRMLYFGTGEDDTTKYNDWYALDLSQKKWYKKSSIHEDFIIGAPRSGAVCFAAQKSNPQYGLKIRIFVGTGLSKDGRYLNDWWEYLP